MVRIARNLHRKKFSVRVKEGTAWRVSHYVDEIALRDVKFLVSEKGRQRVLENRQKNLHAFAQGNPVENLERHDREITYNPYKAGHFYWKDTGEAVVEVESVVARDGKLFGLGSSFPAGFDTTEILGDNKLCLDM